MKIMFTIKQYHQLLKLSVMTFITDIKLLRENCHLSAEYSLIEC